jgi:transposase
MDKFAIIRLKEQGDSSRKVAKQLGIDRKTVDKYYNEYKENLGKLDSEETNIKEIQEKIISAPKYDSTNRRAYKYSAEIDATLDRILESEDEKNSLLGNNKQQLTNIQIHKQLVEQGFDIGKSTISTKIKEKRNFKKEAFIRQEYDFGDRLEFDFGEVKLVHGTEIHKYHMAVFSSPAADFRWCYLYKNQSKDVFLDAHVNFFEMMAGVHREVVYDNMRNVVSRFIGKNEKLLNEDLVKMSIYYGFDINVTNCFSGNEKGHVEGSVKILRNQIFGPKYKFDSFEAAVQYMNARLIEINTSSEIELEKKFLLPYKPKLELGEIKEVKVNKYSFVSIENNFYSVPDYLVGKTITAKVYHSDIDLYANNHYFYTHKKRDGSKEISIDIRHYLTTFERKPGALRNSLALKSMPELKSIFDIYFKSNPRKFIEILKENQDKTLEDIIEAFRIRTQFKILEQETNLSLAKITMNQLKLYNNLSAKEVKQ